MGNKVIEDIISKSLSELTAPEKPQQNSRTWTSPVGYRYLVQWSNTVLLRYLIRLFTNSLPKSEYRRKAQLDDAARSTVRNLEEGFKRSNTATYMEFIGFSQGSLEEVKGDIRELVEDGFLKSKPGSSLRDISIDLGELNNSMRPKGIKGGYGNIQEVKNEMSNGNPQYQPRSFKKEPVPQDAVYTPLTVLYPPLKTITAADLTFEMFIELINKTDYLLRKLVESLELKLANDQKYYQVGQARIKDAIKSK